MTMEFGHNGCNEPCSTCGDTCAVCTDISGPIVMLLTLSDVVTNSSPAGSEDCEACEDMNVTYTLEQTDSGTAISFASVADGVCGFPEPTSISGETVCAWLYVGPLCGNQIQYSFNYSLSVLVYRTIAGDLRCKIFVIWSDTLGSNFYDDDFALASGATQFECLALDRDGGLTQCSSSGTPRCSVPVTYNLTVAAA